MKDYKIKYVDKIPHAIEDKMHQGFIAYESARGIEDNYKSFSFVLMDENNEPKGVLEAYTIFAEIYINNIWVAQDLRGKGYGKRLLETLEQHFIGKGFNNINLVTSAFQAPGFYQKCGFTAEFVRENIKNPQFSKTFYVKFFKDEVQTQGLLKNIAVINEESKHPSLFSVETLKPLIQSLAKDLDIVAVLCYGSYAEGTFDEKSDIDLLVICEDLIPYPELRQKVYEQHQIKDLNLEKSHENWETTWTPINDEFLFNDKKIEIGYNMATWVEEVVNKVTLEGKTTLDDFQFRPYTLLALLEQSQCLYEKNNWLTTTKKQLRPFSQRLKKAIIQDNLTIFNESLNELENFNQRNIGILAFQFMLFRALDAATQILFAMNEVYYPASKREETHLLRLAKLPKGLHELIYDYLPTFYQRKQEILVSLKEIKIFIDKEKNNPKK
ncbi:MAG: GNAT family N-acetyltransferase [Candidatus Berkiella sp.]